MRYLNLLVGAMLLLCVGCKNLEDLNVDAIYVQADKATYALVAPVLSKLADTDPTNDPDLTGVNGLAVLQALKTWALRIATAEVEVVQ
jgi:hypothetical protein